MASEVGVLDVPPDRVLHKGRLQPGRMLLVDTEEGRIVGDDELKHRMATAHPYRLWLNEHLVALEDLPDPPPLREPAHETVLEQQQAFGYTFEELRIILGPMAAEGGEPVGSMGTDTPLAVLSDRPQPLYNYFKQLFAQVTNPPLDAIRLELVTSGKPLIGPEGNLLDPQPESCRMINVEMPFLDNRQMAKLKALKDPYLRPTVPPILFPAGEGPTALEPAPEDLFRKADQAIDEGANIIIFLSRTTSRCWSATGRARSTRI